MFFENSSSREKIFLMFCMIKEDISYFLGYILYFRFCNVNIASLSVSILPRPGMISIRILYGIF